MGGAAVTLSAAWAIASLKIPVNLVLCCALTESAFPCVQKSIPVC